MTEDKVKNETSNNRPQIEDRDLPTLRSLCENGHSRLPGQSRYDFSRNYDMRDDTFQERRFKEVSDEEAETVKRVCGEILRWALENGEKTHNDLSRGELVAIYDLATRRGGLSRLEAEELANDSVVWLEFCLQPTDESSPGWDFVYRNT